MEHKSNKGQQSLDDDIDEENDVHSSFEDNVEELEEEVNLHEATLATLSAKLDTIDASIARERCALCSLFLPARFIYFSFIIPDTMYVLFLFDHHDLLLNHAFIQHKKVVS